MSIMQGDAMPAYQVSGISPGQYSTDPAGNTVQGHIVHYELADGTPGQVFVPDRMWNAENARIAVEDAVRTTWSIRSLGASGA